MKKYIFIARVLVVPTILLSYLIFYDVFMPIYSFDIAEITGKSEYFTRNSKSYYIKARGEKADYNEQVNIFFYNKANKKDNIRVGLTRYFKEWKTLQLVNNKNQVVAETRGSDIYAMGIFGFLFLVPITSFFPISNQKIKVCTFISLIIIEPLAILLWMFSGVIKSF
ncbi:MAG: hypothetical protein KAI43_06670 [Candidatus Aureabacteria bacterium]|nr:hypothetical protein [Candidatus Auribacterota bacterium]